MAESTAPIKFECTSPILRVGNLAASLAYYTQALGFQIDWNHEGIFASVSRQRCNLMLCEGDQGHPGAWVWLGVSDCGRLHREFTARGAIIRNPPTNFPWAYEMQVADPDGNVLRFGSESVTGQPYGPWLDMYGKKWGDAHDPAAKK